MLFLLLFLFPGDLNAEIIDRVVAIVNKEPILASELKKGVSLDELIDDKLIELDAKKQGIYPSELDIDQAIQSVIKQNNLTPATLEAALKAQKLTLPSYRKQLRKQMLKARLIQNKIKSRLPPSTQTQIRIEAEQATFQTREEAQKALKNSKLSFKHLGTLSKEDYSPEFWESISTLKEGEISRPIASPGEFKLIRVIKRIEIPLEKVDKQRYEQELENAFKRYVAELKVSAYIKRK